MNYKEVESRLQGRNYKSKKFANNTYLQRHDNYLAMLYHSTEVVKWYPNGDIVLDNGGWFTSSTKERINSALSGNSPRHYLSQNLGVWYLSQYKFKNGITVKGDGTIINFAIDNPKADKKLKAKVRDYATLCANSVPLPKPDSGDCWYCSMQTEDGESLGDAIKNTEHLDSHIAEKYIVPSLVFKALRQYGNTDFILSLVFNNPKNQMLDIAKERVKKSVYRYIMQRKGYAI